MNTELFDSPRNAAPIIIRAMSPKQRAIWLFCCKAGKITLDEATQLVGGNVYHNAQKHTGAILANMVKQGILERVKPGVFRQPSFERNPSSPV